MQSFSRLIGTGARGPVFFASSGGLSNQIKPDFQSCRPPFHSICLHRVQLKGNYHGTKESCRPPRRATSLEAGTLPGAHAPGYCISPPRGFNKKETSESGIKRPFPPGNRREWSQGFQFVPGEESAGYGFSHTPGLEGSSAQSPALASTVRRYKRFSIGVCLSRCALATAS